MACCGSLFIRRCFTDCFIIMIKLLIFRGSSLRNHQGDNITKIRKAFLREQCSGKGGFRGPKI